MILNASAEKLKRHSKKDFKGRRFEAWLIVQAVTWYLRYPPSIYPAMISDAVSLGLVVGQTLA